MLGWKRKAKRPSKATVEAVSEALTEIEAFFEMNGFAQRRFSPSKDTDSEEEPSDEEWEGRTNEFDREEVEISVGVFISELVKAEVIKKSKPQNAPTMKDVFIKLFGRRHKIIGKVESFEEHTEGYFDAIVYDEMRAAYEALLEIRSILADELGRYE